MQAVLTRIVDVMGDRRTLGVLTVLVVAGIVHALDAGRRAAEKDAGWLRQRLAEKRALVRALQADLADVAEATERVSQMASIARERNVTMRRLAQVEEPRDAVYTPARLAALDDATVHRSDDGARAIAQLAFLEEQLAATADSLALMAALANPERTVEPAPRCGRPSRAGVRSAIARSVLPDGWPVAGEVSSAFGWRHSPYGRGTRRHTGVDITAPYGTLVRVSAAGVVVFAGRDAGGYGSTVVVDHGDDVKTLYGHLSGISVDEGARVAAGTVIGAVGNTGRATGVHLHYEVRVGNVPVDPLRYGRPGGAVERVTFAAR
jgi:murein DD-endopeptidase MepM/ murein hydrolase activator NlpD